MDASELAQAMGYGTPKYNTPPDSDLERMIRALEQRCPGTVFNRDFTSAKIRFVSVSSSNLSQVDYVVSLDELGITATEWFALELERRGITFKNSDSNNG